MHKDGQPTNQKRPFAGERKHHIGHDCSVEYHRNVVCWRSHSAEKDKRVILRCITTRAVEYHRNVICWCSNSAVKEKRVLSWRITRNMKIHTTFRYVGWKYQFSSREMKEIYDSLVQTEQTEKRTLLKIKKSVMLFCRQDRKISNVYQMQ